MAKKVNPNLYRLSLYKYTNFIFTPYSLFNYTQTFLQSLQIYNYILNILSKSFLISLYYHPFFLNKRSSYKYYVDRKNRKNFFIKTKKNKKLKYTLYLKFKITKRFRKIQKYPIYLKKTLRYIEFQEKFFKYLDRPKSNKQKYRFFKLFKVPYLITKINKSKNPNIFPIFFPIKSKKKKKFRYTKKDTTRLYISDIYLLHQKDVINIFVAYTTPSVFYYNLFLHYYKRAIFARDLMLNFRKFFISKRKHISFLAKNLQKTKQVDATKSIFLIRLLLIKNMFYKISQEQVEAITKAFYECNAPVKLYENVLVLFKALPKIEEESKEKTDEPTVKDVTEESK
jgi:hypothetical protein